MNDVDADRRSQGPKAAPSRADTVGMSDAALEARTRRDLSNHVAVMLHDALNADCVDVLELNGDSGDVVTLASCGWSAAPAERATRSSSRGRLVHTVLSDRRPLHRVEDHLTSGAAGAGHLREEGVRCGICMPIESRGKQLGMIGVYARNRRLFDQDAIATLEFGARVMAQFLILRHAPVHGANPCVQSSGTSTESARAQADMPARAAPGTDQWQQMARMNRIGLLGQMSAGIAHELHQPLTAIANYAAGALALIDRHGDEASIREALSHVTSLTFRTSETIRRMRSLVCASEVRRTTVSLNDLIREVGDLVKAEAAMKSIALSFTMNEHLPPVSVDPVQIQQVALNLLRNAIDAVEGQAGDRAIHVESHGRGRFVGFAVRDNGSGPLVDDLQHLFEPFFTSKPEGTGMGLSICRSIVDAHGGEITVERAMPSGLRFSVKLPRLKED